MGFYFGEDRIGMSSSVSFMKYVEICVTVHFKKENVMAFINCFLRESDDVILFKNEDVILGVFDLK